MARTKTTPGPKSRYGDREEIHIKLPKGDLDYIRSQGSSLTEWIIKAIKEKRERDDETR